MRTNLPAPLTTKTYLAHLNKMTAKGTTKDQHAIRWAMASINLLAMLAADTPQFFNPLHAMAAQQLRDEILKEQPNG